VPAQPEPSLSLTDDDLEKVVKALATASGPTGARCVCIKGKGKVGKTVLSAAVLAESGADSTISPRARIRSATFLDLLCMATRFTLALSADVSTRFKDGMFWLDVGHAGSERVDQLLIPVVRELHDLLVNRRLPVAASLPANTDVAALRELISKHELSCLLVLDDVWTANFELRLRSSSVQYACTYSGANSEIRGARARADWSDPACQHGQGRRRGRSGGQAVLCGPHLGGER
jgi:hypothetical protein